VEEPVGSHVQSINPRAFESSAGADKDSLKLRIEKTNSDTESAESVNVLEESAGGTSPTNGIVSSTHDSPIADSRKVRKTKKKHRKPVKVYSEPFIIPPGHVWLAGDNTANSTDSRYPLTQSINLL
jgi:Signal peptidase, peptidase S26